MFTFEIARSCIIIDEVLLHQPCCLCIVGQNWIYRRWVASDLMAHCKPSTSIGPECLYVFGSTLIWWLVIYYLHLPLIPNVLYSHFMDLYACRCDWLQQARICYSTSTTYFQIFVEPKRNRLIIIPNPYFSLDICRTAS